jgi:predicted  nucleic acid-binding Zn-ribbon protein
MTEKQLLDLKDQIEDAKQSVSELKGQQTALLKQLKDTYKCSSIEEAEKKAEQMKKDIDKLQKQIDEGCKELEEKYDV